MPGGSTKKKKQKKKQDNRHAVTRSNGDEDASSNPSPVQHSAHENNSNDHVKIIIKAEDGEFVLFILVYHIICLFIYLSSL
jgi:hypothetical protein